MTRALAFALLLPLAACRTETTETATPEAPVDTLAVQTAPDTLAPEASGDAMPLTKQIDTTTEGEPITLTAELVREAGFPLPFATYKPESLAYDLNEGHEGSGAQFSSGSGDYKAWLTVFVPASAPSDLDAWVLDIAESMGEPFAMEGAAPWVEAEYTFSGIDLSGTIRAGRHAGQAFYVLETLPAEMGDGWAPLANAVVSEWIWLDDGTTLR